MFCDGMRNFVLEEICWLNICGSRIAVAADTVVVVIFFWKFEDWALQLLWLESIKNRWTENGTYSIGSLNVPPLVTFSCRPFLSLSHIHPGTHSHTHTYTHTHTRTLSPLVSSQFSCSYVLSMCNSFLWLLPLRNKSINAPIRNCNVVHLIFDRLAHLVTNAFPIQPITLLAMHVLNIVEKIEKSYINLWKRKKHTERMHIPRS